MADVPFRLFPCTASLTTYKVVEILEQWLVRVILVLLPLVRPRPENKLYHCYCLVLYSDRQREGYLVVLSSPQNPKQNFNQTTVNSVIFQIWQYNLFSLANSVISSGMKILLCKKVSIISISWQFLGALWFPLCLYCLYKNTFHKIPALIGLFFLLVLWLVEQWWEIKICLRYNFFFIDRKKH